MPSFGRTRVGGLCIPGLLPDELWDFIEQPLPFHRPEPGEVASVNTARLHRSNSRYRRGERCAPEGLCLLYGDATPDLRMSPSRRVICQTHDPFAC